MSDKHWLSAGVIPKVEAVCGADKFENVIREMGVGYTCEWFGHDYYSNFSKETVNTLCERSGIEKPYLYEEGEYKLIESENDTTN